MATVVRSHRDLYVWQRSIQFVKAIYGISRRFPAAERYSLTSQLTRAAISVPANIAEGNARGSRKDYAQFVAVARGSLAEVETYLVLAVELGYVTEAEIAATLQEATEIGKMLTALRTRLMNPPLPPQPNP